MLMNSVIVVLREVLEAAVLMSLLVVYAINMRFGLAWLRWCIPLGLLGISIYTVGMDEATDWLDGTGQEIVNAMLQLTIYLLIAAVLLCINLAALGRKSLSSWCRIFMGLAIATAMIREGSEIVIYTSAFMAEESLRSAVLGGSVIGAGIGLSVGILLFYFFRFLARDVSTVPGELCLALVGGGMVMQANLLIDQAGWLDYQAPLWDSNFLISEGSLSGQLLYAIFGYEATPTPQQMTVYVVSILLLLVVICVPACVQRYKPKAEL